MNNKVKVTLEYPNGLKHEFELLPCQVSQTRDLIPSGHDLDGHVVGWAMNPMNPGIQVQITGKLVVPDLAEGG